MQYLFNERDEYTFMDAEDFTQFVMLEEDVAEQIPYLVEEMEGVFALLSDGKVLAIELPPAVTLKIAECDPSARGASATARTKNAVLETGGVLVSDAVKLEFEVSAIKQADAPH